MSQANRYPPAIVIGKATQTVIEAAATYARSQGELGMATDVNRFYIGNSSYRFQDICNFVLPHIVTFDDSIIVHNDETVWI